MAGIISVDKLNPHPKNDYYFTDLAGEKYEEIKRSIETYGIRDPLKVTTAYTVISGHQRLRIAKDIGLTEVPVDLNDINEWDAEYLLIAENIERRGEAEPDPIKKARIGQFLKEYWGVKRGGDRKSNPQNGEMKTAHDVSDAIGVQAKHLGRVLKLNDLIPELQTLVSSGNLGTTAAEQLAYLTCDEQRALLSVRGEENVGETTVAEAKEIREQANESRESGEDFISALRHRAEEAEAKASELARDLSRQENETERLIGELEEAKKQAPEPRVVEKEVIPDGIRRKLAEAEEKGRRLEVELAQKANRLRELERLERSVKIQTESPLYDLARAATVLEGYLNVFTEDIRLSRETIAESDRKVVDKVKVTLGRVIVLAEQSREIIEEETTTVIATIEYGEVV